MITTHIAVGHCVMPRFVSRLTDKGSRAFTFAMASALMMAFFAGKAGLHLIIGAFLHNDVSCPDDIEVGCHACLSFR